MGFATDSPRHLSYVINHKVIKADSTIKDLMGYSIYFRKIVNILLRITVSRDSGVHASKLVRDVGVCPPPPMHAGSVRLRRPTESTASSHWET